MKWIPKEWIDATTVLGVGVALYGAQATQTIGTFAWWIMVIGAGIFALIAAIQYWALIFKKEQ